MSDQNSGFHGYVNFFFPRFHGQLFFDINRRKICSCKFNSVAKFHCQISVTMVSELSNISNLCYV